MRWLRLQLPVLYLASILLAGALPCASHAATHEAAAPAHQGHLLHSEHDAHVTPATPCNSGEALCGCEGAAGKLQSAVAKPRDESAGAALAADSAGPLAGLAQFQIAQRSQPPERQSLFTTFYDGIHGRSARLLI
ncbi:hypothetical protein [Parvibaculum sp.]|uniref:hypothetical protein n=1 Tax=Parvibaculum sp. TaxID=2024848 RepID=UPI00391B4F0E